MVKKEDIQKSWNKTSGFKTTTATLIWLTMRIINSVKPEAIPLDIQVLVIDIAEVLAAIGVTDKLWRNRQKIINSIKNLPNKAYSSSKEFIKWLKEILIKNR